MPTIQKIYYIYIVAFVLKDVEFPFMELRIHHLILGDWTDKLASISDFLVACHDHKCKLDLFTIVLWILPQISTPLFPTGWRYKIWFYLPIQVFSMHDLQTESDQLLIKSNISLIHFMAILHLKEQKYV